MTEFRCPRRDEGWIGDRFPGPDVWRDREGIRACSYCGSTHPDDFFAALEAGNEITPTDKNYKAYIDVADPLAGQPRIISLTTAKECPGEGWRRATKKELERDGWGGDDTNRWARYANRGPKRGCKFYFQHLDDAGQKRFIDLLNGRKLNIAYPGHFYRPPFFVQFVDKKGE